MWFNTDKQLCCSLRSQNITTFMKLSVNLNNLWLHNTNKKTKIKWRKNSLLQNKVSLKMAQLS